MNPNPIISHSYKILSSNEDNPSNPLANITQKCLTFYKSAKKVDYVYIEIQFKPAKLARIEFLNYGTPQIEIEIYNKDSENNTIDNFTLLPKAHLLSLSDVASGRLGDEKPQIANVSKLAMMVSFNTIYYFKKIILLA